MKRYIITDRKTGKVVADGIAKDCVRQLRFASINSFRSMVTHCKTGANLKYKVEVIDGKADKKK